MHDIDNAIAVWLNRLAHEVPGLDFLAVTVVDNNLFKGAVLLMGLWWCWFRGARERDRAHVLATMAAAMLAALASRSLALVLPFQARPLYNQEIGLRAPFALQALQEKFMDGWSAFPSDNASFFYALSLGLCFISRKLGLTALLYTSVFIVLPRIFLGLHYLSDVLAGAGIGALMVILLNYPRPCLSVAERTVLWARERPAWFYPLFFLVSYQLAEMFESARRLARVVAAVYL